MQSVDDLFDLLAYHEDVLVGLAKLVFHSVYLTRHLLIAIRQVTLHRLYMIDNLELVARQRVDAPDELPVCLIVILSEVDEAVHVQQLLLNLWEEAAEDLVAEESDELADGEEHVALDLQVGGLVGRLHFVIDVADDRYQQVDHRDVDDDCEEEVEDESVL